MIGTGDLSASIGFGECGYFPQKPPAGKALLYLALSGEGRAILRRGTLEGLPEEVPLEMTLKKGNALLPPRGYQITSLDEGLRLGWITLWGERMGEVLSQMGLWEGRVATFRNICGASLCLEGLSHPALSLGEVFSQLGLFYQLLSCFCEEGPFTTESQRDMGYVKEAKALLRSSYREGVQISEVAEKIGISRNYLSAVFKRETGLSPQQYLMDYRMGEAVRLLRETKEPIKSVGAQVGYADYLSFSKAFHRRFGKSPSAFREEPDFVQDREAIENVKPSPESEGERIARPLEEGADE